MGADLPDTTRPLDVSEILEDEYAALHAATRSRTSTDRTTDYRFSDGQVRDIRALAQMVCDGAEKVPDPSPTRAALTAIVHGQPGLVEDARALRELPAPLAAARSHAFTTGLVDRLNALLDGDLVSDRRFHALHRLAGVVTADAAPGRLRRANRLLLEAALAPAVARWQDIRLAALYARLRPHAHTALCLSGGGIRSCTFALGVVTALARHGLLGKFDYLSTVSGGGYLGGFLSAWMAHDGADSVHRSLGACTGSKLNPDPRPIHHLRAYTSFLAPRLGVLSADMWTLIGTLIRNLLLNWLVILPLLAGAVMLPRVAVSFLRFPERLMPWAGSERVVLVLLSVGAFALGTRALAHVFRHRPALAGDVLRDTATASHSAVAEQTQGAFIRRCLVPLVLAALAFSFSWWLLGAEVINAMPAWMWFGPAMAMGLLGWLIGSRARGLHGLEALVVAVSSAIAGLLAPEVLRSLKALGDQHLLQESLNLPPELLRPRLFVALAVPIFLLLIMLGGQLFIGLSSARGTNSDREWNARANAWLLIVIVTWVSVCGIVLFLPPLFENGWQDPKFLGLHAIGGLSGLLTALLGASSATPSTSAGGRESSANASTATRVKRFALAVAAPVFAVSLLAVISIFNAQGLLHPLCQAVPSECHIWNGPLNAQLVDEHVRHAGDYLSPLLVLLAAVVLMAVGAGLGLLIDTNQFSLHAMYRSRLVRTFLGASRSHAERSPDPFTGFDEQDDLPIGMLWPPSGPGAHHRDRDDTMPPLHVVNVTLNVVARRSLAWQERKAESMTVSSLHAGGPFLGYRRTRRHTDSGRSQAAYGGPDGISLGTAITISGAAASPEAGYNSSPTISFLMALFNARLGWWLGNPGAPGDGTFARSGPRGGVIPVLSEMFGLTTDRSRFVFLSDGGHFDNLGLYSMVLRRCRLIVLSDAGCDPASTFEDLGNAIRKIRIDLGVPIEFPADRPPFGHTSTTDVAAFTGWAVGRIRYSAVDRPDDSTETDEDYDGVLIYLKPTLSGGEPVDVVNYSHRSDTFPHESTTNQFFNESQFESYRSLGIYETDRMCRALGLDPASDRMAMGDDVMHSAPMQWLQRQRAAVQVDV